MLLAAAFALSLQNHKHRNLEKLHFLREDLKVAVAIVGNDICDEGGDDEYDLDDELMTTEGRRIRLLNNLGAYFVGGPTRLIYYSWDGKIWAVNRHDKNVHSFGSFGKHADQFTKGGQVWWGNDKDGPQYLGVGPKGDIYASDAGSESIKHFTGSGKFLGSFSVKALNGADVTGLAVDSNDNVYASCTGSPRAAFVACFSPHGSLMRTYGSLGDGPGQFRSDTSAHAVSLGAPIYAGCYGVAVGPDGKVYAVDNAGAEVEVFDRNGQPLKSLAYQQQDMYFLIYAIAVDKHGTLYAATTDGLSARKPH